MTNSELIRTSDDDSIANFLYIFQAVALLEGKAYSEEWLREWLDEEPEDEDDE